MIERFFPRAAIVFAAVLALAGCGEGSSPTTAPTPGPTPTRTPLPGPVVAGSFLPNSGSIYFGAYVNSSGLVGGNTEADIESVEAAVGRRFALHMQYEQFTANFTGRALQEDFASQRVPVVSWNCGAFDSDVAAGKYDSTIQLKALEAKNYGWPVFVRFFWDPNLPATMLGRTSCFDPNTDIAHGHYFSPQLYIQAWNRVHQIFASTGATNVIWVWTVSNNTAAGPPLQYYPGAGEVDWVGIDAYDLNNGTFPATFSSEYALLTQLQKPMMIAETGAAATEQQDFFTNAVPALKSQFPAVKAFLYYDSIDYVTGQNQDWRVTPNTFAAFSALANDPYTSAQYVP